MGEISVYPRAAPDYYQECILVTTHGHPLILPVGCSVPTALVMLQQTMGSQFPCIAPVSTFLKANVSQAAFEPVLATTTLTLCDSLAIWR